MSITTCNTESKYCIVFRIRTVGFYWSTCCRWTYPTGAAEQRFMYT